MSELTNDTVKEKSSILLGFFVISLVAFLIRIYGAINLNFTGSEASYVLGMSKSNLFSPSIIQNLINSFNTNLAKYTPLSFRLTTVIAGTSIVFLPYFLRKKIGNLESLLFSFFLAFDPFLIANSITITGNSFVMLAAGLLLISYLNEKYELIPVLVFLLLILGRGSAYLFIISVIFLAITSKYVDFIDGFKSGITKNKSKIQAGKNLLFLFILVIIVFMVASSKLNIFISDFTNFYRGLFTSYKAENSIFLYPAALILYVPLAIFLMVSLLFFWNESKRKLFKYILVWSGIAFLLISIYPGHRIIDLMWVSVPLWFLGVFPITKLISDINQIFKKNLGFLIILLVSIGNLILGLISFTYKVHFGLPIIENLVAIFTIIVFMIALFIYWAYLRNFRMAIKGSAICIILFLIMLQFSNSIHTTGFSGKPEREIFWDGYYSDKTLVDNLVDTSIGNQYGTMAKTDVWVDAGVSPQVYWDYGTGHITEQIADETPEKDYLAIFKDNETPVNLSTTYLGQKFVAESYPAWVISPLRSLFQDDFWSWFFFRDSQQLQSYNYLWLRADHIPQN